MSLKIECDRCNAQIEHVCHCNLPKEVKDLFRFTIGFFPDGVETKDNPYYSSGDEKAPFFSEAYLYTLFGKEQARTILGYLNSVIRAAGLDPYSLQAQAHQEMDEDERKEEERQQQVAERKRRQEEAFKPIAERMEGSVKVLTYPFYPALDHALRKLEKAGHKFSKLMIKGACLQLQDRTASVVHEITLNEAKKFLRYELTRNNGDGSFLDHSYRIGVHFKAHFKELLPEIREQRDRDLKPFTTMIKGVQRQMFKTALALDETLYGVWALAFDPAKTREAMDAVPERTYGVPYIDGDLAVISLGGIEYAAPVSSVRDKTPTKGNPDDLHLSRGMSLIRKLVCGPPIIDGSTIES